jgi:hypothetical protein|tara:strand:- start:77 stop:229 length:153 start_codon:yes stop_codon:yes gene_type:complete
MYCAAIVKLNTRLEKIRKGSAEENSLLLLKTSVRKHFLLQKDTYKKMKID